MKVTVEVDCTPEEARRFFGLPDVVPMQQAAMEKLQQRMESAVKASAELERGLISQRTKAALAASKARGKKLGGYRGGPVVDGTKGTEALQQAADDFAASVAPMVREMRASGLTLREIAEKLAADGIRTARAGPWTAMAVKNVLDRSGDVMAKAA